MTSDSALPLPDYDELPITELQHRIRSLPDEDLRTLIDYEESHANRTPVLELLRTRQSELAEGAEPSGGDQQADSGKPADTSHGSPVSADSAAQPSGPLRHGVAGQTPGRDRP
ncbi:hypothetical protein [Prauserella rugosa]|uniref:DUF8129 domain-containing protein n=1 Tax=Prauserella rugosa TaxID=43354 RepID=A0A660CJU3_9PSEU|nr:hypothetical protein [Prauserella rugosa]KID29366.1 hypothetical protein HQ32_03239 [Prauserella sp. Am3]KMS84492.1 hypothetical protein ACZ91_47480 [Streptomyces regensis]TWH21275.1 hypothetical protein JD82_03133 [Prauserella rugosa]